MRDPKGVVASYVEWKASVSQRKGTTSVYSSPSPRTEGPGSAPGEVLERLRARVVGALHVGRVRPGDRLPSIRALAREWSCDHRAVAGAYHQLAREGLVVVRGRGGVYAADVGGGSESSLGEVASWVSQILSEAWRRQIPVGELSALIHRYTVGAAVRCAFLESVSDSMTEFGAVLRDEWGLEVEPILLGEGAVRRGAHAWKQELGDVDFVATTTFHAAEGKVAAEAAGKPCLVLTTHSDEHRVLRDHFADAPAAAIICVDRRFGSRLRAALHSPASPNQPRILQPGDASAIRSLGAGSRVLVTRAARDHLGPFSIPVLQHRLTLSPESVSALARSLVLFSSARSGAGARRQSERLGR